MQTTKTKTKVDPKQPNNRKALSEEQKYETYHDYRCDINRLRPHQVLAINRGEKQKYISVSIQVPDAISNQIKSFLDKEYFCKGQQYEDRTTILERSYKDCYAKKCRFPSISYLYLPHS